MLRADTLDRMFLAVELVRQRLIRATAALEAAAVPYAVIGGHAVASWVAQVDVGQQRGTRDVDLLIRRSDFDAARAALETGGFIYTHVWGVDVFVEDEGVSPSQGVHLLFAGEPVKPDDPAPTPDVADSEVTAHPEYTSAFRVISLESLVRMKLVSNRRKDQVHLEDLIRVGLIDASWPARYPPVLAARLQHVLDTPDG